MPLTITRRKGQRILIGDNIVVQVSECRGDRALLTITAPATMRIDRDEVRNAQTGTAPRVACSCCGWAAASLDPVVGLCPRCKIAHVKRARRDAA